MASRLIELPWDSQPQEAALADTGRFRISRLSMPGVALVDLASGKAPTTVGTATASGIFIGPSGLNRQQHLSAGANGFAGWSWDSLDGVTESNDATMIFVGEPLITGTEYGGLLWRGLSGSGWNLAIYYENTVLRASCVTASPLAGHNADITHGHTMGQEQRIALVKRGLSLSILDWRTRKSTTITLPSTALRTSPDGLRIGGWSATAIQGNHRHALDVLMPVGLHLDEVWSILDNPWQLFQPRRIWVPVSSVAPTTKKLRTIEIPWDSQPQELPEIEWSDPLAQGLIYHVNFAVGSRDLVGPPGVITDTGTIGQGTGSGRYGSARGIRGSASGRTLTNPSNRLLITSGGVTHAGLIRLDSLDSPYGTVFAVSGNSNFTAFSLQRNNATTGLYLYRSSGAGTPIPAGSATAIADGKTHLYVAVSEDIASGAVGAVFIDGVKYAATNTASTGSRPTSGANARFLIEGTGSASFGADGDYFQHWSWDRALSDAEALAFTENPQRLYRARRIYIPGAVVGGGLTPILSAATWASLTSTTVRPRVTVTF